MKNWKKLFIISVILIMAVNVLILINRNKGFEYQKISNVDELYPSEPDSFFIHKWTRANQRFSLSELDSGLSVLKKEIGIEKSSNEEEKVLKIAGWIYKSFYQQLGNPSAILSEISPLQQYFYLVKHKDEELWCGNFQAMAGFFFTASGLPNRYVETVPTNESVLADYHEVNEIYLPEKRKWIMVDATNNILLISRDKEPLSAAAFLDYMRELPNDTLYITCSDTLSFHIESLWQGKIAINRYFNKNYSLRYYHTMTLSEVYAWIPKIKRYVLADPWYEIYDPGKRHSNFLFRVKQFLIFIMLTQILFSVIKISTGR